MFTETNATGIRHHISYSILFGISHKCLYSYIRLVLFSHGSTNKMTLSFSFSLCKYTTLIWYYICHVVSLHSGIWYSATVVTLCSTQFLLCYCANDFHSLSCAWSICGTVSKIMTCNTSWKIVINSSVIDWWKIDKVFIGKKVKEKISNVLHISSTWYLLLSPYS